MENIYSTCFSISQFAKELDCPCYKDDLTIAYIDHNNLETFNNTAEEMFLTTSKEGIECCILLTAGEITATIDYITYNITAPSILYIQPLKILTKLQAGSQFTGYILINSRAFANETILNRKSPVSINQLIASDRKPFRKLSSVNANTLQNCIINIGHYINQTSHRLQKELLSSTFYILILESAQIVFNDVQTSANAENSTKKIYIEKFIKLLVQHAHKEHNPSFYADKLCISVQYLSLILKEISGKTTNSWIAGYLITRAKVILRNPETTIQQITEALNFSDQSSFGKFFKKHTGVSPKRYKEEH